MKNTLWVFGDSYATEREGHLKHRSWQPEWAWYRSLGRKLRMEVENHALGGGSNEYTMKKFHDKLPLMQQGDPVVIILTEIMRKWVIKDRPILSFLRALEREHELRGTPGIPVDIDFFETYWLDVWDEEIEINHTKNFLNTIAYMVYKKKINPIVLPSFPSTVHATKEHWPSNIPRVDGNLNKISVFEIAEQPKDLPPGMADFRNNHLAQSNHEILAHKIFKALLDKKDINLKKGFKKDLYTQRQIKEEHNPDGKLDWLNDNWGEENKWNTEHGKAHLTDDGNSRR
tara:strand:+ start:1049 stop:1906 length:858 start_codon:yes stop_codon:yes gene_type:complete